MLRIWDGEGTGNTVPSGPKRKNFQVQWENMLTGILQYVKNSATGVKFSFRI